MDDLRRKDQNEQGQSFVEMAISIVFILILLAGIVDLGRMFFVFVSLRDAAQEGASYASFCPADISGIQARVRSASSAPINLYDTTNISIIISPDCSLAANALLCETGDGLTVTVSSPNFAMSMPFLGGVNIPLSSQVTDSILTDAYPCPP
jgi:Flp pilus assembly protein TadG